MNNPYCKHGYHVSIRCFSCEQDKKDSARALKPIFKEAEEITKAAKREAAKKRVYESAKGLDW